VCIALCTIVAHNIAQNRPDSFPPYPPDNHHSSDDVYLREEGGYTWGEVTSFICGRNTITTLWGNTVVLCVVKWWGFVALFK